jgi:hypothetical protein
VSSARESRSTSDNSIGIKLLDAPLNRRDDPRAQVYIVDFLAPGTTIKRRVLISNTSRTSRRVAVFVGAASIDNNMFDALSGVAQNELTSWSSVDRNTVDIAAGGTATAMVTIAVPRTASAGERYAVIWAQTSAPADPSATVTMVSRVGVRIYLDVGTGGEPPSSFGISSLTAARTKDGQPEVSAAVRNTGGRALDMAGQLALSDGPGSLNAGPFPVTMGTTLLPNHSGTVRVLLDRRLPAGPWKVRLRLVSGAIERTVTATLTFPAAIDTVGETVAPGSGVSTVLLIVLAVVLAVAVGAFLMAWRRRTSHAR